jgi:hypothetical protein
MPKPKFQRADAFDQTRPAPLAAEPRTAPYINAGDMNSAVYENGASSFPMSGFEDPVEKENQELKGQLADLMEQLQSRTSDLVAQDGTLMVQGFQFTPTGLIAPEDFDEKAWDQIGQLLFKLEGSLQWLIGDWIVYGNQVGWGDIPKLSQKLGREAQTLRDYSYVSRKIHLSFRNDKLTYTHHVVAAKANLEPEQLEYAFAGALHFGFSVSEFRKWINLDMPETGLPAEHETRALPAYASTAIPKPALSGLEKLAQRDASTLKPKEIAEGLGYITQARQWLDEMERQLRGDHNA